MVEIPRDNLNERNKKIMSKNQECLDKIGMFPVGEIGGEYDEFTGQHMPSEDVVLGDCFVEEFKSLQKLVNKDKERPVVLKGDGFYCPACGMKIEVKLFYAKYCHMCGQKLDRGVYDIF